MRIREDNRNMVLLVAVTLVAATVAGVVALIEPAPAPGESRAASVPDQGQVQGQVRVVGPPFVPNTNPRDHR
jgi:hypothetical protein